jgi:N-carbamoyl-L-amino-acid hydrolase
MPASVDAARPGFDAYFEAHIEQGPVLEDANTTIGVVTGALGQRWYDVTVTGMKVTQARRRWDCVATPCYRRPN